MFRTRDTDKLLPALVSYHIPEVYETVANIFISGSGCVAALEAEKFLAELEDVENDLEAETEAEKGNSVVVPEYRGNPLL